jgi:hypothetical protein
MRLHKKNLPLGYHTQDKKDFCGAACAQMILHQMGTGILEQKDLFKFIQANNSAKEKTEPWNSGPTGLNEAMNFFNPHKDKCTFEIYNFRTEHRISRKIVWTIIHYQVAPIALVMDGSHWVAVKGFQTDQAVKSADDVSYGIVGFFINDPRPITPEPHPPPAHELGDRCGDSLEFGIDNQHISYNTWVTTYMTSNQVGKFWKNKFIAICDPEPAPRKKGKQIKMKNLYDGKKMIDKESAIKCAMNYLKDFEMSDNYNFKEILNSVTPGNPVIVQRLDKKEDYYYLVPMEASNGNVHCLVSVDGRFGDYRESCYAKGIKNPLGFKTLNQKDIYKRIEDWLHQDNKIVVSEFNHKTVRIDPMMRWKPCKESYSPYLPFYVVSIGKSKLFVRIDGKVFTELTQTDTRA